MIRRGVIGRGVVGADHARLLCRRSAARLARQLWRIINSIKTSINKYNVDRLKFYIKH
jgi:hypothetical protein